jgi:hypothetical protein
VTGGAVGTGAACSDGRRFCWGSTVNGDGANDVGAENDNNGVLPLE